jgi:YidC/Oxa1 family membrane protein insertase
MNMLIVLTHYLFSSFGLAIIALTIVVNILMYPLTKKQLHATQAMQSLQPKLSELQKKYGKDRQRLAQEQMRLYKESGVNPAGCLMPMLIQLPIWIALYQSIIRVLAWTPEDFLGLSRYLYSWQVVYSSLPLADKFLWFSLAVPDAVLAVLVMITMWLQQKMVTPPTTDPKQQSMSRMMLWTMPLMFGFLCLSFPSGLALFWVTSSVIRIAMQYFATGWGGVASSMATKLAVRDKRLKYRIAAQEAAAEADIVDPGSEEEEGLDYEESGGERQDRGGGYSASLRAIRRQPRRGRSHRRKRR